MTPPLYSLRLQLWLLRWQWPRWRVRLHLRLWLRLARLLRQLLRLPLWLWRPQLKRALRLAWLQRLRVLQLLPDRSMRQRHCPKRS
jgi:hypothetical protein